MTAIPTTDEALIAHLARGGRIMGKDEVSRGYRGELMRLMTTVVDSELAGAAGLADYINRAPGLRERRIAAQIVSEKFGHAEAVLALMEPFGVNPALYVREHSWTARLDRDLDLGNRRVGGDRRLNVFHYPIDGWTDAVVFNWLMSTASAIQLDELAHSSYAPLAEVMAGIVAREAEHARHGKAGVEAAAGHSTGRLAVQASIVYWRPRVAASFGRTDSDRFALYTRYGLRRHSNAELLGRWTESVTPLIAALGPE